MKIESLQKRINAINYWDCEVLDFSINYFGDEIRIVIDSDSNYQTEEKMKQTGNAIKFLFCYKVDYITDAKDGKWRKDIEVKDMNRGQLGHYMQSIEVNESEIVGFIEVILNTSLLYVKVICKNLFIEKIEFVEDDFFWSVNKKAIVN